MPSCQVLPQMIASTARYGRLIALTTSGVVYHNGAVQTVIVRHQQKGRTLRLTSGKNSFFWMRLGVLHVFMLFCVFVFVQAIFVFVPLNFKCLHCLQHSFFEHLFNFYNISSIYIFLCFLTFWSWALLFPSFQENSPNIPVFVVSCCQKKMKNPLNMFFYTEFQHKIYFCW